MSKGQAFNLTPAELREKWIEALESGRFKQTTGALKRYKRGRLDEHPVGHCCLGVFCEVYAQHGGKLRRRRVHGCVLFNGSVAMLPDGARQAAGLSTELGNFYGGVDYGSLSGMNDSGATFQEIARLLRNPPPGLLEAQS